MSLSNLESIILISLKKNRGRSTVFSLFRLSKVPMAEFLKALSTLKKDRLVKWTENEVFLEAVGLRYLMHFRQSSDDLTHPGVPAKMLSPYQLPIHTPYIPAISRLDKRLLLRSVDGRIKAEGGQ